MLERDTGNAARRSWDLIVLGGGVYGCLLALEASLRGLSCLLLEKDDFGGATSANSMRTIHGGLRYLQTLDLKRHRSSAREQSWFFRQFPDMVVDRPFLMPLYQRGLRRTGILRMALLTDRLLARGARSHFGDRDPFSGVVSKERVLSACPEASSTHLAGGAFWKEGWLEVPQRLVMEVLRSAAARGAAALNYVAAEKLVENGGEVRGVEARDAESGENLRFDAPVVINATGPWAQDLASGFGYAAAGLFHPSAAWNMLVRREPRSLYSLAVADPAGGPFLFLHPWGRHTLIGTGHAARTLSPADTSGDLPDSHPTAAETEKFLASVNAAMPGWNLEREDVLRVFSGYLPADGPQSTGLRKRALVVRHGSHRKGGFYSVSGVKYTEAHEVAVRVLDRAFPATAGSVDPTRTFRDPDLAPNGPGGKADPDTEPADAFLRDRVWMRRIIDQEAVRHLDDLIFRRTTCGDDPEFARRIAPHVLDLFDWDAGRRRRELARVERICLRMDQLD